MAQTRPAAQIKREHDALKRAQDAAAPKKPGSGAARRQPAFTRQSVPLASRPHAGTSIRRSPLELAQGKKERPAVGLPRPPKR